jgi:hypothetical protein
MILAEMEDPSTAWHHTEMIDEVFRLGGEYDEGLYIKKHKKKSLLLPLHGPDGLLLDDVADSINDRTMAELLAKIQSDGNYFLNDGSSGQVDSMANHDSGSYISLKDIDECLMSHDNGTADETLASPEKVKLECGLSNFVCQETDGVTCKAVLRSPLSMSVSAAVNNDLENVKNVNISGSYSTATKGDLHETTEGKQYDQMRKKPVSQTLAWYQNSRKRKISSSAGSVCRTRNSSQSMEIIQPVTSKCKPADSMGAVDGIVPGVALNNSDMEVYGRIPENCCSNDDVIAVETASLGTDGVQINICSGDAFTDILPVGFSLNNVDGYLWDATMHLFEDDDGLADFSPNVVQSVNDSFSLNANMLGIIADSFSCDMKNEDQFIGGLEQTKSESLTSQNIKCELPSDCFAFPDEIFPGTLPSFDEAAVSLNYVNNGEDLKEVRRRPGRPRKKSLSQSVAWYRSHRKRQVSISNSSFAVTLSSSSREHSWDEAYTTVDRRRHCQPKKYSVEVADSTTARKGTRRVSRVARKSKPVTGRRKVSHKLNVNEQRRYSWGSSCNDIHGYEADCRSTTISCDSGNPLL